MNRAVLNTRQSRIAFHGDRVRPKVGYDSRCSVVVHRHLIEATTSINTLSRPVCSSKECVFAHQYREYHQMSLNLPSRFQQRPQLQIRNLVYDSRKARITKKQKDPFKVLKVPKESLYKDVKVKFLKIAMANHPDMHTDGLSENEQQAMRDRFIEARMAFERLEEDPTDGTAILKEELIDRESNFDSWFKNETGLKNPFDVDLDPETMKEVAEMTEKMGGQQGMERDGGSKYHKGDISTNGIFIET